MLYNNQLYTRNIFIVIITIFIKIDNNNKKKEKGDKDDCVEMDNDDGN